MLLSLSDCFMCKGSTTSSDLVYYPGWSLHLLLRNDMRVTLHRHSFAARWWEQRTETCGQLWKEDNQYPTILAYGNDVEGAC